MTVAIVLLVLLVVFLPSDTRNHQLYLPLPDEDE